MAVSIAVQFLGCAALWLAELFSSSSLIDLAIYFYWPFFVLMGALFELSGQKGEFAVPILAMLLGMVSYGIIFGAVLSFLKKKRL